MVQIGLISDTHGYFDPRLHELFSNCQEIWHAGDIGGGNVLSELEKFPLARGVYGNIDGQMARLTYPETSIFILEGLKIVITHIGGYPGRYAAGFRELLIKEKPDLFICGHSHILKVIRDKQLNVLHLNPGACGFHGFQQVRTALRFTLDNKKIEGMEVIELEPRFPETVVL